MINYFSDISLDFLQNENIVCFLCDTDGTIRKLGRGLQMRYPNIFRCKTPIWDHLNSMDVKNEMLCSLKKNEYYITPVFPVLGKEHFLCCFSCYDPQEEKYGILCKLEAVVGTEKESSQTVHYRSLIESFNSDLLSDIATQSRNITSPADGENIARMSEALIRNRLLLNTYLSVLQTGRSEETVLLKQLCTAVQTQLNTALLSRISHIAIYPAVSGNAYYLDTERFFEMLISLITMYYLNGTPSGLQITLTEKNGRISIQSAGAFEDRLTKRQTVLFEMLEGIILQFAKHYGGSALSSRGENVLTVGITFRLISSPEKGATEVFENQNWRFSAFDRILPLLHYADR